MKLEPKNRYIVHFNAQAAGYKDEQVNALYRTIEERFHAIPGVVKVGVSTYTPMEGITTTTEFKILGQPNLHKCCFEHHCEFGVFRFGGDASADGTWNHRAGHRNFARMLQW